MSKSRKNKRRSPARNRQGKFQRSRRAGDRSARKKEGAGKRPTNRLESLATHDEDVARGEGLEALQVGGQVPRNLATVPDNVVFRTGSDERDTHTAMGAVIRG